MENRTVIELLMAARDASTLEFAEFGQIFAPRQGERVPYPSNENEVTAFILDRVKLHHSTWITGPIIVALKKLGA